MRLSLKTKVFMVALGAVVLVSVSQPTIQAQNSGAPTQPLTISKSVSRAVVDLDSDMRTWNYTIEVKNTLSCDVPINAAIVFDRSSSMADDGQNPQQPLTDSKTAVATFLAELNPSKDRVGLVTYKEVATTHTQLTNDFGVINAALEPIKAQGRTNIADGISQATAIVRGAVNPVIIMFTDGIANRPNNPQEARPAAVAAAANAKAAGITVVAIGLGRNADLNLLPQIASPGRFYFAPTTTELIAIFKGLAEAFSGTSSQTVVTDDLTALLPNSRLVSAPGAQLQNSTLRWDLGSLSCGETRQLNFTLEAVCPVNTEARLNNLANVASLVQAPIPSNTVTTEVRYPNVSASITHSGSLYKVGDTVQFTVLLKNNGTGLARNVTAQASIPAYLQANVPLTWQANLNPGESREINFTAQVTANAPEGYATGVAKVSWGYICGNQQSQIDIQTYKFTPPTPDFDLQITCKEQRNQQKVIYLGYENRLLVAQELSESRLIPDIAGYEPLRTLLVGSRPKAQAIVIPDDLTQIEWRARGGDTTKSAFAEIAQIPECSPLPPVVTLPPIQTVIGAPVVSLPASSNGQNFPPQVKIADLDTSLVCSQKRLFINTCDAFDLDGQVVAMQYSLNNGDTWYPVTTIQNLGTASTTCKVASAIIPDGNYQIKVRAFDNNGNIGVSNPLSTNVNCEGIVIGSSQFNQRDVLSPMSRAGTVQAFIQEPLYMAIDILGGPQKVVVEVQQEESKSEFSLTYNQTLELWEGELKLESSGLYDLLVKAYEADQQLTQRYTNSVQAVTRGRVLDEFGKPITGAKMTAYVRNQLNGGWQVWNGAPWQRFNPHTQATEVIDLLLMPGNYYLTFEKPGYFTTTTREFEVREYGYFTQDVLMYSQTNLLNWPNSLALKTELEPIKLRLSPGLQEMLDKPLPEIAIKDKTKTLSTKDIVASGKTTVLVTWTDWDTPSSAQMLQIEQIYKQEIPGVQVFVVGLLEGREENLAIMGRGEYEFELYKPADMGFFDQLQIVSAPQYYFVDQSGVLRTVMVGNISIDEYNNIISDLIVDINSQETQ